MTGNAQRVRRRRVLILGAALAALLSVLIALQAFSIRLPAQTESAWPLYLLSTLSFLAVVVLTVVLARQILKLLAERRGRVVGSRFKTRLVLGALALSLTPVVCMFGFTYLLINRTLDKWFSQPVVAVRDDNRELEAMMSDYIASNATHEAISLANSPEMAQAARNGDWPGVRTRLQLHEVTLEGGYVRFDRGGKTLYSYTASARAAPTGQIYLIGNAALRAAGGDATPILVEVGMPRPPQLTQALNKLAQDDGNYTRLTAQRRNLRLIYTLVLLLLALAILFASTWLALYLAKGLAGPVGELIAATQEISRGNLAYRVGGAAPDEFRTLMRSFNGMAGELEANRSQIEASRQDLQAANRELEARRSYTEALLDNTPSAVISLDGETRITRINAAVRRLFGAAREPERLDDLFEAGTLRELRHLLRKAERWPSATGQVETHAGGRGLTLAVTAAALRAGGDGPGRRRLTGWVLVMEDLTDLLRIQKTAAWREVAQRIAHEIKNPLTPIALSAQRIRRRLENPERDPEATQRVVSECAATIEAEAHSLQRLVDEFSAFARFPSAQPESCDLNEIIERALRAFDGRLDGIEIRTEFEALPALQCDPEEMKRVFINLIDNAAEAMHDSPYRQITLATHPQDGTVEAVVADTGHGLPPGDKQRLFLPYFSTKARGTGLGLAIVARIVEECGGTLRVEDNTPVGARFIVELPSAEAAPAAGVG